MSVNYVSDDSGSTIAVQIPIEDWKRGKKSAQMPELISDETLKKLGDRIKQLRIKKGYTSYEYFAYDHNISRA